MSSGTLPLVCYHRADALGSGSYGAVIAVYDDDGNEFALKLFDTDEDEDECGISLGALREISILRLLRSDNSHPNIISLHDVQTGFIDDDDNVGAGTGGCLAMAMPLFRLGSLSENLSKVADKKEKVLIAHGILSAVAHLHDNSILHRDIKSDNVVLACDDGDEPKMRPVLIDFSLAKILQPNLLIPGGGDGRSNKDTKACCDVGELTHTPEIGTPSYRSPEAMEPTGEYSYPSDMWSTGVVLLELLQGKMLNAMKDKGALPEIESALEKLPTNQPFPNLVRKLLEKDPTKRLTAREALESDLFRKFGLATGRSNSDSSDSRKIIKIDEAVPFDNHDDDDIVSNDKENTTTSKKSNKSKSNKSSTKKADPKLVKRFKKIQNICHAMEWTNPITAQAAMTYSIQMSELCEDIDELNENQELLDCIVLAHKFFERDLCDITELKDIGGKTFQNWDLDEYIDNESTIFMMIDFCLYPRKFHQL